MQKLELIDRVVFGILDFFPQVYFVLTYSPGYRKRAVVHGSWL